MNWTEAVESWKEMCSRGQFAEAEEFYYETLFDEVIRRFLSRYESKRENEALVSLLGFSQEPVILTAKAINPTHHLVLLTSKGIGTERIREHLIPEPQFRELRQDDYHTLYACLKEMIVEFPTRNITIDISGGKKSMVATASIFAKDYGCRLVYVDFDVYLKELRKPEPGTEFLLTVYRGSTENI